MRQSLVNRFRYLWTFELLNALVVFPVFVLLMRRNFEIGIFTLLAVGLVCVLLVIGAGFAYIKYRDLQHDTQNLNKLAGTFRLLRNVIPVVLVVVFLLFVLQLLSVPSPERVLDLLLGFLLYALAVLEYINYFHTQLMYDNRRDLDYLLMKRKLKRGLMAREFGW